MNIQELHDITKELIEKGYGDFDIRVSVRDHYSAYGETAEVFTCDTGSVIWDNFICNSDCKWVTLQTYLTDNTEGKHPKITFRK